MVRERLKPTVVLNSWKAPHCGALWAGRARKRLRPFILHKIERVENRSIIPARAARKRAQAAQNAGDTIPAGRRPASFSKSAHSGPQGQTAGTSHRGCGNKKRKLHNVRPPMWVAVRCICCTNWLERSAALLWRRREKHNSRRTAAARQGWADAVRRRRGSAGPRSLGRELAVQTAVSHISIIVMSVLCSGSMPDACVCGRSWYRSRTEEQS